MDELMTFLVENQMLLYAVGCLLLLFILVVFFPKKKKNKKQDIEVKEEIVKKKFEEFTEEEMEELIDDDIFLFEKVTLKEEPKVNELDNLLEIMEQDLEKEKIEEEPKDEYDYEDEQEKTAIISYQELLKAAQENKIHTSYDDEEAAITSTKAIEDVKVEEVIETIEAIEENNKVEVISNEDKNFKNREFKNSDIISPIFGKQEAKVEYPKIPSFKRNQEEPKRREDILIKEEMHSYGNSPDEEFLKTLIDFRNQL